ncbi:POLDIP3 family protein [Megaselia abdita]
MDLSLDEIIAKKKSPGPKIRKGFVTKRNNNPEIQRQNNQHQLLDARNRIIQKNRHKIKDARDKIVEKNRTTDARIHLIKKAKSSIPHLKPQRKSFPPAVTRRPPHPKAANFPIQKPRGYVDYDNMERQEEAEIAGLRRTIENDLLRPPRSAFPEMPFRDRRKEVEPFDIYNVQRRSHPIDKPMPPRGNMMDVDMDVDFPLDIHRSVRNRDQDPIEYSHLSLDMKNRLQNPPDVFGGSHGIFSNPLKKTISVNDGFPQGYRIVVSNLHNSVTESDIKELFQEIGDLSDARLVRTGVAEVIFKREKDAMKAVEVYHNRQLDSLPMKCLLVKPRASDHPTAPALSSRY